MGDFPFEVRTHLPALGEMQSVRAPLTPFGVPVVGTVWDQFALGGYMFNTGEPTIGTPVTAGTADAGGILLTAPAVRLTVPDGVTVFPRRIQIAYETAAGTLNEVAVVAAEGDSFATGGTALTVHNWRTDNPRASVVKNVLHGATEGTLGAARHLYKYIRPAALTAGETHENIDIEFDDLRPIVGPASLLVYVGAATTEATICFAMDWAEVPTQVI